MLIIWSHMVLPMPTLHIMVKHNNGTRYYYKVLSIYILWTILYLVQTTKHRCSSRCRKTGITALITWSAGTKRSDQRVINLSISAEGRTINVNTLWAEQHKAQQKHMDGRLGLWLDVWNFGYSWSLGLRFDVIVLASRGDLKARLKGTNFELNVK